METPAQYERDLRSANKQWKRGKDASAKWSHGARPLHGCRVDWATMEASGGSEAQRAKARPRRKISEEVHYPKKEHNITKTTRGNYTMPAGRVRTATAAREEIDDVAGGTRFSSSIADLLLPTSPRRRQASVSDNFLYSFDTTDSPGRPVTLEVFVKTNGRDTERLIEAEYEVLDGNGDALTGRRARRNLRQGASLGDSPVMEPAAVEDEGFELI